MWDKIGYILSVIGFCFAVYIINKHLKESGFFIKKDVKNHFCRMQQVLAPYSSMREINELQIKFNEQINGIAKNAKTGKLEQEFLEKSKTDYGVLIFPLIFIVQKVGYSYLHLDEKRTATNALVDYCKRELLKYKEYAPEIFWDILYLDKESFYKDIVEKE